MNETLLLPASSCLPSGNAPAASKEHFLGIDYLRAFFSVCVVLVHLGYVSRSTIFSKELYLRHTFTASDFVNFYLLTLAVPVFFIISNYLFLLKPAKDLTVLGSFLKRIGKIAVFWIVLYHVFFSKGWEILALLPRSPLGVVPFVLSGAHTAYYFLVSLFLLTLITYFCRFLDARSGAVLFLVTMAVVFLGPIVSARTGQLLLIRSSSSRRNNCRKAT